METWLSTFRRTFKSFTPTEQKSLQVAIAGDWERAAALELDDWDGRIRWSRKNAANNARIAVFLEKKAHEILYDICLFFPNKDDEQTVAREVSNIIEEMKKAEIEGFRI